MSLKTVHLIFITVATLFSLGFGIFAVREYRALGDALYLVLGILGLIGAVGLPIYGAWFLKKMKDVSFI